MPSASRKMAPFSTPQPPRKLPGPPESVTDLVPRRQHRAEALLRLERLDGEAHPEDRRRRVRAVLAVAAAPAADHPVVPHEDRPALVPRVAPADEQVLEVERAGERALRHELRPELEDRVHDLLVGAGAEAGHGDRPGRVDHRPDRPEVDLDGAVEAGVERHVGEERLRPGDDARESGAEPRVDEAADRRVRPGEVVGELVALDRHLDLDRDQPFALGRVVVDVVLRLPRPVGQLRNALARQPLDVVLHLLERGQDRLDAVLVDEPEDLLLRHPRRRRLRVQIALGVRGTRVFETIRRTTSLR